MKSHSPTLSLAVFYSTTAIWNITNGMMMILVPLYALSLGFSVLKIGSVIALPVLMMFVVRFIGGALCDRFGERLILQICYLLSVVSVLLLIPARGFASLLPVPIRGQRVAEYILDGCPIVGDPAAWI